MLKNRSQRVVNLLILFLIVRCGSKANSEKPGNSPNGVTVKEGLTPEIPFANGEKTGQPTAKNNDGLTFSGDSRKEEGVIRVDEQTFKKDDYKTANEKYKGKVLEIEGVLKKNSRGFLINSSNQAILILGEEPIECKFDVFGQDEHQVIRLLGGTWR